MLLLVRKRTTFKNVLNCDTSQSSIANYELPSKINPLIDKLRDKLNQNLHRWRDKVNFKLKLEQRRLSKGSSLRMVKNKSKSKEELDQFQTSEHKMNKQAQTKAKLRANSNLNSNSKFKTTTSLINNYSVIIFTCIILFTTSQNKTQAIYLQQQQQLPILNNATSTATSFSEHQLQQAAVSSGSSPGMQTVNAIAPTIDYSHNMRILKLPKSTPIGSLVYRLRGSDPDPNTQLSFGVSGGFGIGRSLLDVVPVAHSWNEADVYLRSQLEQSIYNLTVYVTDGNKTTQVESTLIVTNDDLVDQNGVETNKTANLMLSPFVNPKHVFHVPENSKLNEPIGFLTVLESLKSDLPVRFELRGKGADKFAIKYVFGPKGQSKGEIVLTRELDYEKQNLFTLKVLALNAWTNTRFDTRNVASLDIVITVGDVQDTAPIFKSLPHSINLANNLEADALVVRLEAEDGDYADQRPIQFALDANSPLTNYFSINKLNGEIRLLKAASELALHAAWDSADWSILTVFASELPDTTSYEHLWPPMYAKAELPLRMVDVINDAPQFLAGWQTTEMAGTKVLHAFLVEPTNPSFQGPIPVRWYTNASETGQPLLDELSRSMGGRPLVLDLGLGNNGTFELSLDGPDAELFQIEPSFPVSKQATFNLFVANHVIANRSQFDFEQFKRTFIVELVARDLGQPRKSSRIKCLIELMDSNDNAPQFETDLYSFNVYENAQVGTLLGVIRARDIDAGLNGRVNYNLANSPDSNQLFHLDSESGQLTLKGQLDRERKSSYLLVAEARDLAVGLESSIRNITQILINIYDVNDNAPQFLQSHYDAVLLADGTFHQPLVVKALDLDEPNTANSQVAYEIIAGNSNEQFSIDSVSGVIYPTIFSQSSLNTNDILSNPNRNTANILPQIPPILNEPIVPFNQHKNQAGKILPSHEIEETTSSPRSRWLSSNNSSKLKQTPNDSYPTTEQQYGSNLNLNPKQKARIDVEINGQPQKSISQVPLWFRKQQQQQQANPQMDTEQLPALDLLLNLESSEASVEENNNKRRSIPASSGPIQISPHPNLMKVPPMTTLIVRAHDFGIPLRSSTVRVNIFNQALLTRSISVILNGTADQLELRREAIEKAFSSMTGSKAMIESIDALSESSSISVAQVKLTVPQHSLVDLTDLSALMSAIDYKLPANQNDGTSSRQPVTHYITDGGRLVPVAANITTNTHHSNPLYTDIHSYQLDDGQQIERKLLIYIIIVVICIAILLLIWIVYYCTREKDNFDRSQQIKQLVDSANRNKQEPIESYRQNQDTETNKTTTPKSTEANANSAIKNNLNKQLVVNKQLSSQDRGSTTNSELLLAPDLTSQNKYLTIGPALSGTTQILKPDHMSMYNGQVWFEPSGNSSHKVASAKRAQMAMNRRASSAPSGNSLDSGLNGQLNIQAPNTLPANAWRGAYHVSSASPRDATGQFFPNTVGYLENLDALSVANQSDSYRLLSGGSGRLLGYNGRKHRVAPKGETLTNKLHSRRRTRGHLNKAFEHDEELSGRNGKTSRHRAHLSRTETTSRSGSSAEGSFIGSETESNVVVLDSDQELLGFDSTGTPIIATHAQPFSRKRPLKTLVVDVPSKNSLLNNQISNQEQKKETKSIQSSHPKEKSDVQTMAPGQEKKNVKNNLQQKTKEESEIQTENQLVLANKDRNKPEEKESPNSDNQRQLSASSSTKSDRLRRQKADSQGDLMSELNGKLISRRKQSDGALQEKSTSKEDTTRFSIKPSSGGTNSSGSIDTHAAANSKLRDMKNSDLLEKQSIFTITYSGLATDKLPA